MAQNTNGIIICCRYAYPPNSLSLCGPENKTGDLQYSSTNKISGQYTEDALRQFATLYPYLLMIAYENNIRDPFDRRVVEAYWLGNSLLEYIPKKSFAGHLRNTLSLKKKMENKDLNKILEKLKYQSLPNHSFHVLNVYKRTGHLDIKHTVETMDACIINWGQITEILPGHVKIKTQRLIQLNNRLTLEKNIIRKINMQDIKDKIGENLSIGDYISYHWGILCQKITPGQMSNLKYYTGMSLNLANIM